MPMHDAPTVADTSHVLWFRRHLLFTRFGITHSLHATHVHLARPKAQEKPPRNGITAIDSIQHGRLGVEGDVASNRERQLVGVPNIPCATKRISTDAKRRMTILNSQQCAVSRP